MRRVESSILQGLKRVHGGLKGLGQDVLALRGVQLNTPVVEAIF